eukprot:1790597-Karenia_brevis.AAC.1
MKIHNSPDIEFVNCPQGQMSKSNKHVLHLTTQNSNLKHIMWNWERAGKDGHEQIKFLNVQECFAGAGARKIARYVLHNRRTPCSELIDDMISKGRKMRICKRD